MKRIVLALPLMAVLVSMAVLANRHFAPEPTPYESELIAAYCGERPIPLRSTDEAVKVVQKYDVECK